MFSIGKVVTRIEVSVVFDDRNITAGRPEDTQRMLLLKGCSCSLLENLHFDSPDIPVYPLVEDSAEKNPQGFRRNGALAYATFDAWLRFDQRQKANILRFDLLEESVNLGGGLDVIGQENRRG